MGFAELDETPGLAAYRAGNSFNGDERYCFEDNAVCRKDTSGEYVCRTCSGPNADGWGCPCGSGEDSVTADCGEFGLQCLGEAVDGADPHRYPAGPKTGACFESLPPGYCADNCEAQARVCGRTIGVATQCVAPECFPPCETDGVNGNTTCDRDAGQCVAPCTSDGQCAPGICTQWGECWG